MDVLTPEQRRKTMAAVKSRDTKPELTVRRLLHAAGYRFRLHRKDLPGKPDIVLPKFRTVVFVHGCFWHQHVSCKAAARPTSKQDYWQAKLDRNIERDIANQNKLLELGWKVLVLWECEIKSPDAILKRVEEVCSLV
ncbi:DNA mismatch endonuclease Vsr [Pseudoduganella sp. FT55W]|uniref:Very short patch repair endonuclease n=2 Tax=Duganella rivi TaxID=2666083 RepID=A0A7X4GVB1_9BURK|nr:DNA mismatch endonuclease Vsr [Duganella rivi]